MKIPNEVRLLEQALGAAISQRRQNLGYTQEQLAKLLEIHRTYFSDIEHGKRNFTVLIFLRLAKALQITPLQLLEEASLVDLKPVNSQSKQSPG